MKSIITRSVISIVIANLCLWQPAVFAQRANIKEFALPSEVKDIKKVSGSVYYSPTSKGKVLIPVHIWGEISRSGLHYIPVDTSLVKGLSLAGGPKSNANLDNVKLTRLKDGQISEFTFDLSEGGNAKSYRQKLNPGDTIFIEKDRYYENRTYYTSLLGVVATLLSSFVIFREVRK